MVCAISRLRCQCRAQTHQYTDEFRSIQYFFFFYFSLFQFHVCKSRGKRSSENDKFMVCMMNGIDVDTRQPQLRAQSLHSYSAYEPTHHVLVSIFVILYTHFSCVEVEESCKMSGEIATTNFIECINLFILKINFEFGTSSGQTNDCMHIAHIAHMHTVHIRHWSTFPASAFCIHSRVDGLHLVCAHRVE